MEEGTVSKKRVDARCLPSQTTNWLTPRWILDALGEFDLDPCVPERMPWCTAKYMRRLSNGSGLAMRWFGRVWLNPPYGRGIADWMKRMAEHGNGIALVFARTDAKWFQKYVLEAATSLLFLDRRVRFCRPDGTPGGSPAASSVLAAYGTKNANSLWTSELKGFISCQD